MLRRTARCSYLSSRKSVPGGRRIASTGNELPSAGNWLPPTCAPWLHQLPDCGTLVEVSAGDDWESPMSTETSVRRQRDPGETALGQLLIPPRQVGVGLCGHDLRFTRVNAAFARAVFNQPGLAPSAGTARDLMSPEEVAGTFVGLMPSEAWPGPHGTRAEAALRKVLAESVAITEPGPPLKAAGAGDQTVESTAFWFPLSDGAHNGAALILTPAAAAGGAVPVAGPGRRPSGVGGRPGRRDDRGRAGMALDHRPDLRGVRGRRLARVHPPGGQGACREVLAGLDQDRQDVRRPVPYPHQVGCVPAL